jgi:enoyl-CoA hydratase/carnithine racemase
MGGMVRVQRRERTTWITLDAPERLNAFTVDDYHDVRVAFEAAAAGADETRAVVITGTGRAFSAGADRSLVDGTASESDRGRVGDEFVGLLQAVGACPKPVVAAVNGLAVGIGSTLLLHCDLVVAAESARFRFPFTALGMAPEAGSSVLLPARARWGDTMWALLSSEWIDSATARDMGLVWRVVPDADLIEEAGRVTGALAALDPDSVTATKRLLTVGRAELVAAAMERETAATADLVSRPPSRN